MAEPTPTRTTTEQDNDEGRIPQGAPVREAGTGDGDGAGEVDSGTTGAGQQHETGASTGDAASGTAPASELDGDGIDPADLDAGSVEQALGGGRGADESSSDAYDTDRVEQLLTGEGGPGAETARTEAPGSGDIEIHEAAGAGQPTSALPSTEQDYGSLTDRSGIGAPGDSYDFEGFGELIENDGGGSTWVAADGSILQHITPDGRLLTGAEAEAYVSGLTPSDDSGTDPAGADGTGGTDGVGASATGGSDAGPDAEAEDGEGFLDTVARALYDRPLMGDPPQNLDTQGGQGGINMDASRMTADVDGHQNIEEKKTREEIKTELEQDGSATGGNENIDGSNTVDQGGRAARGDATDSYTEESYFDGRNGELQAELRNLQPASPPQGDTIDPNEAADDPTGGSSTIEDYGANLGLGNPDGDGRSAAPAIEDNRGDDVDPLEPDGAVSDAGEYIGAPDLELGDDTIDLGLDDGESDELLDDVILAAEEPGPEAADYVELDILE